MCFKSNTAVPVVSLPVPAVVVTVEETENMLIQKA